MRRLWLRLFGVTCEHCGQRVRLRTVWNILGKRNRVCPLCGGSWFV